MTRRTRARRGDLAHRQLAMLVLRQFRVVYGSVRRHSSQVRRSSGLSGSQAWILHELAGTPGLGIGVLAERLSVHQSTMSQLVKKLQRAGYVHKARVRDDQRRVGLYLSSKGTRAVRRTPRPAEGVLPSALGSLSDASLRKLHANLARLIRRLEVSRAIDAGTVLSDL
jgi:DNA-binding MarR family transcriptional regulator